MHVSGIGIIPNRLATVCDLVERDVAARNGTPLGHIPLAIGVDDFANTASLHITKDGKFIGDVDLTPDRTGPVKQLEAEWGSTVVPAVENLNQESAEALLEYLRAHESTACAELDRRKVYFRNKRLEYAGGAKVTAPEGVDLMEEEDDEEDAPEAADDPRGLGPLEVQNAWQATYLKRYEGFVHKAQALLLVYEELVANLEAALQPAGWFRASIVGTGIGGKGTYRVLWEEDDAEDDNVAEADIRARGGAANGHADGAKVFALWRDSSDTGPQRVADEKSEGENGARDDSDGEAEDVRDGDGKEGGSGSDGDAGSDADAKCTDNDDDDDDDDDGDDASTTSSEMSLPAYVRPGPAQRWKAVRIGLRSRCEDCFRLLRVAAVKTRSFMVWALDGRHVTCVARSFVGSTLSQAASVASIRTMVDEVERTEPRCRIVLVIADGAEDAMRDAPVSTPPTTPPQLVKRVREKNKEMVNQLLLDAGATLDGGHWRGKTNVVVQSVARRLAYLTFKALDPSFRDPSCASAEDELIVDIVVDKDGDAVVSTVAGAGESGAERVQRGLCAHRTGAGVLCQEKIADHQTLECERKTKSHKASNKKAVKAGAAAAAAAAETGDAAVARRRNEEKGRLEVEWLHVRVAGRPFTVGGAEFRATRVKRAADGGHLEIEFYSTTSTPVLQAERASLPSFTGAFGAASEESGSSGSSSSGGSSSSAGAAPLAQPPLPFTAPQRATFRRRFAITMPDAATPPPAEPAPPAPAPSAEDIEAEMAKDEAIEAQLPLAGPAGAPLTVKHRAARTLARRLHGADKLSTAALATVEPELAAFHYEVRSRFRRLQHPRTALDKPGLPPFDRAQVVEMVAQFVATFQRGRGEVDMEKYNVTKARWENASEEALAAAHRVQLELAKKRPSLSLVDELSNAEVQNIRTELKQTGRDFDSVFYVAEVRTGQGPNAAEWRRWYSQCTDHMDKLTFRPIVTDSYRADELVNRDHVVAALDNLDMSNVDVHVVLDAFDGKSDDHNTSTSRVFLYASELHESLAAIGAHTTRLALKTIADASLAFDARGFSLEWRVKSLSKLSYLLTHCLGGLFWAQRALPQHTLGMPTSVIVGLLSNCDMALAMLSEGHDVHLRIFSNNPLETLHSLYVMICGSNPDTFKLTRAAPRVEWAEQARRTGLVPIATPAKWQCKCEPCLAAPPASSLTVSLSPSPRPDEPELQEGSGFPSTGDFNSGVRDRNDAAGLAAAAVHTKAQRVRARRSLKGSQRAGRDQAKKNSGKMNFVAPT